MLTEFLKSIRGEKALWETIITGVDVCNFRLQGNTKDPFIPISLQPLHGNDYRIQKKITERKILYEFIQ